MVSPSLRTVFFFAVSVHDDVTPTRTGLGTHAQLEVDGIHQVGHFIIVHELGAVQDHVIHAGLPECNRNAWVNYNNSLT